jgi:hypothetical protein
MSRWKAAAIHLSISAAIGLVAAILIFGVWYPPPYSQATGATELVVLLLGVDLILGPLLTLVVFRSGKKSLRFDLTVIAVLQACAFLYGMSVVVRARPAFIVGAIDRFVVVGATELDPKDLAAATEPQFRSLPWGGPRVVGLRMPPPGKEHDDLLFWGLSGKDVDKFPRYYTDYANVAAALLEKSKSIDSLAQSRAGAAPVLERWLRQHRRDAPSVRALPMIAPRGDLTMLLDSRSGEVLGAVPISAW